LTSVDPTSKHHGSSRTKGTYLSGLDLLFKLRCLWAIRPLRQTVHILIRPPQAECGLIDSRVSGDVAAIVSADGVDPTGKRMNDTPSPYSGAHKIVPDASLKIRTLWTRPVHMEDETVLGHLHKPLIE
jgi:hypothetical protein